MEYGSRVAEVVDLAINLSRGLKRFSSPPVAEVVDLAINLSVTGLMAPSVQVAEVVDLAINLSWKKRRIMSSA